MSGLNGQLYGIFECTQKRSQLNLLVGPSRQAMSKRREQDNTRKKVGLDVLGRCKVIKQIYSCVRLEVELVYVLIRAIEQIL